MTPSLEGPQNTEMYSDSIHTKMLYYSHTKKTLWIHWWHVLTMPEVNHCKQNWQAFLFYLSLEAFHCIFINKSQFIITGDGRAKLVGSYLCQIWPMLKLGTMKNEEAGWSVKHPGHIMGFLRPWTFEQCWTSPAAM